jgi:hypothetical protein
MPANPLWDDFPANVGWDTEQPTITEQKDRFRILLRQFLRADDPLLERLENFLQSGGGNSGYWERALKRELCAWDRVAETVWPFPNTEHRTPPINAQDIYYPREEEPIDRIEGITWWNDDETGVRQVGVYDRDDIERVRREVARVYDGPFTVDYLEVTCLMHRGDNGDRD